jgi:hypothetical protein
MKRALQNFVTQMNHYKRVTSNTFKNYQFNEMKLKLLILFLVLGKFCNSQQVMVSVERDGIVVFEAESGEIVPDWKLETKADGFSGNGYITWRGENMFSAPGASTITYTFFVINPGTYYLQVRNYHDNPDNTESNDFFTKVNDGEWLKTYSHVINEWNWHTGTDVNHFWGRLPKFELRPGINYLQISGRSEGFSIDRFVFVIAEKMATGEWKTLGNSDSMPLDQLH